jgi:hypothetical protein
MSRMPLFQNREKVCIICEGFEEYDYIEKIVSLEVWNNCYEFILVNAESNGKIPARYQDAYAKDCYDIILVFCDTDKKPYEDYETIKAKIDRVHGNSESSKNVVIFANPCTMQVILLHFADLRLTSHKKKNNGKYIYDYTGVRGYRAKRDQRVKLFSNIDSENYSRMIEYCKKLPSDDRIISSTNFDEFAEYFEGNDLNWMKVVNAILES